MMRSIRSLAIGILGCFFVACATTEPPASGPTAERPNLRPGDTWVYKRARGDEYSTRVVQVDSSGSVNESTTHPGAKFYRDIHGMVTRIEGALSEGSPKNLIGWKFLDFPLAPGKKFKYHVEGATAPFAMEIKITKWEKVSVPAGTFDALRIDACYFNETSRWYGCGQEWWYAPEVKTFIKRRTPAGWARVLLDTDFDLVKFTAGP